MSENLKLIANEAIKRYKLLKDFENSDDFKRMNDLIAQHHTLENDYMYAVNKYLETLLDNEEPPEDNEMLKYKDKYFKPEEFRGWYDKMNKELILKLNYLRHLWGKPIVISPVNGAIGRHAGNSRSRHNIDYYGEVKAIDIFPQGIEYDKKKALDFYLLAKKVGFGGIGVYPHWKPSIGFHLDIRDNFVDWVDVATYPKKHKYVDNYVMEYLSK